MTAITQLDKYQVLVFDDISYVKKTDAETQVLFEFIAHRYESGSLIINSNQHFSQLDPHLSRHHDDHCSNSRIIHHAPYLK